LKDIDSIKLIKNVNTEITFELAEKIARLLKDEKFLALLIKKQWENAANKEYVLEQNKAIPLCASLQWPEEPENSKELQKPQLSGLVDLTDTDVQNASNTLTSITLKGIKFSDIFDTDGKEFVLAIHCQAMSLENFERLLDLDKLPASTTTISFAKKDNSIEITIKRNGNIIANQLSFNKHDDNDEFTLKLDKNDNQTSPTIKLIIKWQSDEKEFTYKSDSYIIISDEMWFSLAFTGDEKPKIKIANAVLPVRNASEAFLKANTLQQEIDFSAAVDTIASARPYTLLAEPVLGPIWTIIANSIKGNNLSETGHQLTLEQFERLFKARIGKEGEIFAVPPIKIDSNTELGPLLKAITKQAEPAVRRAFPVPENTKNNNAFVPLSTTHNINLRIDQLIQFPNDDLWDDLLGSAFLLAYLDPKTDTENTTYEAEWFSLNTSKIVAKDATIDTGFVVDPMPLSAIESSGMRMAMMTFNNRNLVSAMPGDWVSSGDTENQKISKLISNKLPNSWQIPHLAYGAKVALAGYLCGQGGILSEYLRDSHPAKLKKNTKNSEFKKNPAFVGKLEIDANFVHVVDYLRRVPVGAPRLETRPLQLQSTPYISTSLPIYSESLKPLAAELDRIAHRFALKENEQRLFYRSFDLVTGVIDIAEQQGIVLDIMELEFDVDSKELIIELQKSNEDNNISVLFFLHILVGDKEKIAIEASDNKKAVTVTLPKNKNNTPVNLRFIHRYISNTNTHTRIYFSDIAHTFFDGNAWSINDNNSFAEISDKVQLDQVEDVWLCVKTTNEKKLISLRPPLISIINFVSEVKNDLNIRAKNVNSVFEEIAPAHIVMLGMPSKTKAEKKLICKIRPPGLDFKTWAPAIIDPLPTSNSESWKLEKKVKEYLRQGNNLVKINPNDRALDDPYVDGLVIEIITCFPSKNQSKQQFFEWKKSDNEFNNQYQCSGFPLYVKIEPDKEDQNNSTEISLSGDISNGITIEKLSPGSANEIRFYSATKASRFDDSNLDNRKFDSRLAQGASRFIRVTKTEKEEYILGDPLKFRIEIPTRKMPKAEEIYELFSVMRDEQNAAYAQLALTSNGAILSNKLKTELRYCSIFRLPPQRWSWFGRPLPALGDVKLFSLLGKSEKYRQEDWEKIAYAGRSDTRIGPTPSGKLSRELIPKTIDDTRVLHRHNLDYQGTAAYWRFGLELESRYFGMSSDTLLVQAKNDNMKWKGFVLTAGALVRQQSDTKTLIPSAPTQLQRPSIEIILPLTEPLDFDGKNSDWSVPPLLAIFNNSFYEHGNIADRLEVVLTAARHPLVPGGNHKNKYPENYPSIYQEIGPDPILSATGHIPTTQANDDRASIVPVRIDGIIGFTQSPVGESSDQRRAAALISIDDAVYRASAEFGQRWQQWPLASLQLRRYHDPFLDDTNNKAIYPLVSGSLIELEANGHAEVFYIKTPQNFTIMIGDEDVVTISVTSVNNSYRLSTTVIKDQPNRKAGDLVYDDGSDQILRIILTGLGDANGKIKGLHITIAVTTEHRINDAARLGYDPWLGTTPIELDIGDGLITYKVDGTELNKNNSFHTKLRITPFTAPIWCQFTPDTSRFRLTYSENFIKTIRTESLCLKLPDKDLPRLVSKSNWSNELPTDTKADDFIKFESMAFFERDADSNKSEGKFVLFAAITKWIVDASGRSAEHYVKTVLIHQQDDKNTILPGSLLLDDESKSLFKESKIRGRIRILTLMYSPKDQSELNGEKMLNTLFSIKTNNGLISDATNRIVGVSRPIDFSINKTD